MCMCGKSTIVGNATWFKADYHGLYEAIPGFIAGLVLTYGVSYMTSGNKSA